MFILPWLHQIKKSPTGTVTHVFQFFLGNGGTQLLSVDVPKSEVPNYCNENGLVPIKQFSEKNIEYVELDRSKMSLDQFYSFHENGCKGVEAWRTFIWIGSDMNDNPWGVNKYLDGISLSNTSAGELIRSLLKSTAA